MEVVFDTEAEAEAKQVSDLIAWLAVCHHPEYAEQTTKWAIPLQRLDGKWAYRCCPQVDYSGHTTEEYDQSNYPSEAE